jgi:hypothetical protein
MLKCTELQIITKYRKTPNYTYQINWIKLLSNQVSLWNIALKPAANWKTFAALNSIIMVELLSKLNNAFLAKDEMRGEKCIWLLSSNQKQVRSIIQIPFVQNKLFTN